MRKLQAKPPRSSIAQIGSACEVSQGMQWVLSGASRKTVRAAGAGTQAAYRASTWSSVTADSHLNSSAASQQPDNAAINLALAGHEEPGESADLARLPSGSFGRVWDTGRRDGDEIAGRRDPIIFGRRVHNARARKALLEGQPVSAPIFERIPKEEERPLHVNTEARPKNYWFLSPHAQEIWAAIRIRIEEYSEDSFHAKRQTLIRAINQYMLTRKFNLKAHCASLIAFCDDVFLDRPIEPLAHKLWEDLAQEEVFADYCMGAAHNYIVGLCRREGFRIKLKRDLDEEDTSLQLQRRAEILPEYLDPAREAALAEARTRFEDEMDNAAKAVEVFQRVLQSGRAFRDNGTLAALMQSAAQRPDLDLLGMILDYVQKHEIAFDSAMFLRIALICLRAGNLPAAKINYQNFTAALNRGDFHDDVFRDEYEEREFYYPQNVFGLPRRIGRIKEALMETHFNAGENDDAEAIFDSLLKSGEPVLAGQAAAYLRAPIKQNVFQAQYAKLMKHMRMQHLRHSPYFHRVVMQDLMDKPKIDYDAVCFVFRRMLRQGMERPRDFEVGVATVSVEALLRPYKRVMQWLLVRSNEATSSAQRQSELNVALSIFMQTSTFACVRQASSRTIDFVTTRQLVALLARETRYEEASEVVARYVDISIERLGGSDRLRNSKQRNEVLEGLNRLLETAVGHRSDEPDRINTEGVLMHRIAKMLLKVCGPEGELADVSSDSSASPILISGRLREDMYRVLVFSKSLSSRQKNDIGSLLRTAGVLKKRDLEPEAPASEVSAL